MMELIVAVFTVMQVIDSRMFLARMTQMILNCLTGVAHIWSSIANEFCHS